MVQWLRLHASNAGGMGSLPSQGTKIPRATWQKNQQQKQNNIEQEKPPKLCDYIYIKVQEQKEQIYEDRSQKRSYF